MQDLLNALKAHAGAMDGQQGRARIGIVQSINPADHTACVLFQPEGTLSSWLPVKSPQNGVVSLPPTGTQVLVEAQEGDGEHGVVVGVIYNDGNRPPQISGATVQAGEFAYVNLATGTFVYFSNDGHALIQDSKGSFFKLTNDGMVSVRDGHGTLMQFLNNGTVALTGNLAVSGTILVHGTSLAVP